MASIVAQVMGVGVTAKVVAEHLAPAATLHQLFDTAPREVERKHARQLPRLSWSR